MRKFALVAAILFGPGAVLASAPEPINTPFQQPDKQIPPAAAPAKPADSSKEALNGATVTWFGQSCFAIADKVGHLVLTDPYDPKIGYPAPPVKPNIITVSHEHFDHNASDLFPDFPLIIRKTGETGAGGLVFQGIPSWHDDAEGARRGPNTIFIWKEGGLKWAHLGDLGQTQLRADQLTALRDVDVLFVPVGGNFTIDAKQALAIVNKIRPHVVIPMHFKTPAVDLPLSKPDAFLSGDLPVVREPGPTLSLRREQLPKQPTIYLLDYASHQGGK